MFLRHVLSSEWGRAWGDRRTRASAFPGTISARKEVSEEGLARASPGPAAERGANACLGEARKDARARTRALSLEGGFAAETNADGLE